MKCPVRGVFHPILLLGRLLRFLSCCRDPSTSLA